MATEWSSELALLLASCTILLSFFRISRPKAPVPMRIGRTFAPDGLEIPARTRFDGATGIPGPRSRNRDPR